MDLLVIGAGVYLVLIVMLYFLQPRLVYFPTRDLTMTPQDVGLHFEEVAFHTEDGERLAGWFLPIENARATVLFFHGNAGNIGDRMDTLLVFHRMGLSVFIFDYRGYGASTGRPSEEGTYRDARAAWTYLIQTRGVSPWRIALWGRSLGGAIAAWLAQEVTPGALILESTFTSVPDVAADLYPLFPVRWLTRFRYTAIEYVRRVRCPVLVIHSPDDEVIPFHHGWRLFEAAPQPKEFLEIRGSHNEGFLLSLETYRTGVERFLRVALKPPAPS